MQEVLRLERVQIAPTETALRDYLNAALLQTDLLQQILCGLRHGSDLSLSTWRQAFEVSHRTLDDITKVMALAQEVFDGHLMQVSGSLAGDWTCDEFQCLTWK
jgi:hypothetical protein